MLYAHLFQGMQASIKQELGHYDLDMTSVVMRVKAGHEANFVIGDYPLITVYRYIWFQRRGFLKMFVPITSNVKMNVSAGGCHFGRRLICPETIMKGDHLTTIQP